MKEEEINFRKEYKKFDFALYKGKGSCEICEKENVLLYGWPAKSPAEAYCLKCAISFMEKELRVGYLGKDTYQKLLEKNQAGELPEEELLEEISKYISLDFFQNHLEGLESLEVMFSQSPDNFILVQGYSGKMMYIYPE